MRSLKLKSVVAAAVLGAATVMACSDSGVTGPGARPADLAFLLLLPPNNVISTISVQVTGPGIDSALVFNLTISGSTASGSARVPAGTGRRFIARAFDASGVTTHRGDTTVTLVEGANAAVTMVLTPLVGTVPLTLSFGSTVVAVSGRDISLVVGDTMRLTATAINWRGVAVPSDSIRWATSNPAVASVNVSGLVTVLAPGTTDIVATYEGAAARRHVTVPAITTWLGEQVDDLAGTKVSSVRIADADNDGQNELVATTESGLILLYKLQGASWIRQTVDSVAKRAFVRAVGDADNDGKIEVLVGLEVEPIFGNSAAELRLYKYAAGSWSHQTIIGSGSSGRYAVAIGDADGDGRNEMVVGGYNFGQILLFRYHSGSFTSSVIGNMPETSSPSAAFPSVGDAMNLGTPQVYVGTHTSGNIYAYQWNGASWARSTVQEGTGFIAQPQVADFDNDGTKELLISKFNGAWGLSVYGYAAGAWSSSIVETEPRDGVCVADIDGDGAKEIVAPSVAPSARAVYAYRHAGSSWTRSTLIPDPGFDTRWMDVGDARNNGHQAVALVPTESGKIWLFHRGPAS